ncbi:not available (plasmid) [Shigella sonnei]|nr:not available [Shigella sonnei]
MALTPQTFSKLFKVTLNVPVHIWVFPDHGGKA